MRARIARLAANHGALAQSWEEVSDKKKNTFYCECQEKAGTELQLRTQEAIHDSSIKKSVVNFGSSGIFIDEEDLKEKYKRKPEQLASIKANTRTMQCPVRKVKLYEGPEFKLTVDDTETGIQEKKRKAEFAREEEKKKKGRKGTQQATPEEAPEEAKLTTGDKKRIGKKLETVSGNRLQLQDLIQKGQKYQSLVP